MINKIILLALIMSMVSCVEEVVIKTDTPIDNESEEIHQVNTYGFVTDVDLSFLTDVQLTIDEQSNTTDESGFFHIENRLIPKYGKAIKATKLGYLPSYKRIYNHRNLKPVIVNHKMIKTPTAAYVSSESSQISNAEDIKLIIESNDFDVAGSMVFHSSAINNNVEHDNLLISESIHYLDRKATFYIDADISINENQTLDIEIPKNELNPSELSIYFYNPILYRWEESNVQLILENDLLVIPINTYGWWTIGIPQKTKYGSVSIKQHDLPLSYSEILVSNSDNNSNTERLYTDKNGSITKYWIVDQSIKLSIDNGDQILELSTDAISNNAKTYVKIDEPILTYFEGAVFDCKLNLQEGYVGILSKNQHAIIPIVNGLFEGEAVLKYESAILNFYDSNFFYKSSKAINVSTIGTNLTDFVACEEQLLIEENVTVVEGFDKCRIKINPNETVIIGERDDNKIFLISFEGKGKGEYEGLIYSTLTDFGTNVKPQVAITVSIYDEVSNTLAGSIEMELENGEEKFLVSFIGTIE
ncbi:MAG: hypothetical protein V3V14_01370 [Saprospiraceae bacterium]